MYKQVMKHLLGCKSVAVFVHVNPDWDCIGSAFALRRALRGRNVKCDIFTSAPLSDYLGFLGNDVIVLSENSPLPDYECYCAVDVGVWSRIDGLGEKFGEKENTVIIDHHPASSDGAALSIIEPQRSAAGEIIYELISEASIPLTQEIARFLYCALSSDTGSFQYSNVKRRTYEIVIALTDTGIDTSQLCSMLYERNSLKSLYLNAEAIHSIRIFGGGKIATAHITNEILKKYDAVKSDAESLSSLPRTVDGVMLSAFLTELPDGKIRVNLRALGDYDVSVVARHFGGGGHKKASGCTLDAMDITEAENLVVSELIKL